MKKYKFLLPILRKNLPFILRMPFVRTFIKFTVSIILICLFIPTHWITVFFYVVFYALIGGFSFVIIGNIVAKVFTIIYTKITSR